MSNHASKRASGQLHIAAVIGGNKQDRDNVGKQSVKDNSKMLSGKYVKVDWYVCHVKDADDSVDDSQPLQTVSSDHKCQMHKYKFQLMKKDHKTNYSRVLVCQNRKKLKKVRTLSMARITKNVRGKG